MRRDAYHRPIVGARGDDMRLRNSLLVTALASVCLVGSTFAQQAQPYQGKVGRTLAESTEWWPEPVKPPAGSPNVVWILIDDVGFGAASVFGGAIATPNFEALAAQGVRFTNFHTTAICAPTRAALLTGRNSSSVHEAGFSHTVMSAGFPGWDGRIPAEDGTIAEILRQDGYATFAVGKYGVTPDEEASDAGPFDHWPTGKGFDHFFGFLGSQTDQYKPDLVEDQAHVKPDGRHLSEQITDKAIEYIDREKKAAPDKPFFLYYAPGATHAPHQVAAVWSDKYKGAFDSGWDVYRQQVFERQKKMGIIPASAILPDRNPAIKAWSSVTPEERKLYARFMEVYAGYLTFTDYEVGLLVDHLKAIHQFDNTLFVVMIGDNGASKEGTFNGDIDRSLIAKPLSEKDNIQYNLNKIGEIGTPDATEGNYPLAWAQAANTPFRFWKSDANSEGGTRNPLIITWPAAIKHNGEIRTQYGHVIDILPTTLELLHLTAPEEIRSVHQQPIQGTSLAYALNDANAPSRHRVQYYYIFGSRAIYEDGWKASLAYPNDFLGVNGPDAGKTFDENAWELYDMNTDYTERVDLAKKYPEKVAHLRALFEQEAKDHNLYPLINWDDVKNGRFHRSKDGKTLQEEWEKVTKHTD
jgi:arylsulfatase A-like enzyme